MSISNSVKRKDLMQAISGLRDSGNILGSIESLEEFAKDFVDHFESEFGSIEQGLEDAANDPDKVEAAREVALRCAADLF